MILTVTTELGGQQLSLCFLSAEPKHYTDPSVPGEGTAKENSHEGRGTICLLIAIPGAWPSAGHRG